MIDSWDADTELLASSIKALRGPLNILEAGCGRSWPLKLAGVEFRLTGLDLDRDALNSRVHEIGDLQEAIVGDLSVVGVIPANTYDVVYSSFVLEHIRDAEGALGNMINGLKPGGVLLLCIPDRNSVYGWTSRRTPFSVHVAYYRFIAGNPNAGKPGFAPYPTFHAPIVSRAGIRAFCESHGCEVLHESGSAYYWRGTSLRAIAIRIYAAALWALSLGMLAWRHDNLTYVVRKN